MMSRASANLRGAGLMTLCMMAFSSNDACMRAIAGELPLPQAILIRGVLTSILLAIIYFSNRNRGPIPRGRDLKLILLRGVAEIGTGTTILISLYHMDLATVTAIMQAAPLTIALAGALFLGEPIGWRRLTAILVGFVGVMIIIRPGTDNFTVWSLAALAAVVLLTIRDLAARRISAVISPVLPALVGALALTVAAGVWSLFVTWEPVRPGAMVALSGGAVLLACAYLLSVACMRTGEIGFVAPFRYTGLLWALFIGMTLLGEWPDMMTLIGAVVVVASGGYSLWRELRLRRVTPEQVG